MRKRTLSVAAAALACGIAVYASGARAQTSSPPPPTSTPLQLGDLLSKEDFTGNLDHWKIESEGTNHVEAKDGVLSVEASAGLTLWFKEKLTGPLVISYDARAIKAGGANDRVSDLNCFWMAGDSRNPAGLLAVPRTGKFADYNQLQCYYVGLGGNSNTTTRFRRYIGDAVDRPLLKENDLRDAPNLLTPNIWQNIRLVADGHLIQFYRDDKKLFEMNDPSPYTTGYFAFRTTKSHLELRNLKIFRLKSPVADIPSNNVSITSK